MRTATPRRTVSLVLLAALAAAGCTSWQRVSGSQQPSPEESLLQLFNPGTLYRQLGRIVVPTGVPFIGTVAYLPGPGDSTIVMVGLSMTNRALAFEKVGNSYQAQYRVDYSLHRPGAAAVDVGRDASVRVNSLHESLRTDESILLQQQLVVPPGRYQLQVKVADRSTTNVGLATDSITVPDFPPGSYTAPILAYQARGRATRDDTVSIVLNPRGSIAFGSDTLLIYLEGVGYTAPTTIPVQVRDGRDSAIVTTAMHLTGDRQVESQVIRVAPDSAPLGQLQIVVGTDSAHKSTSAIISFSGNWVITNFDDLLSLLRYFGEDNRVKQMRDASPEARPGLWRTFYHETDPNPMTPENERLDAYLGRLAAANRLFRDEGIPGWRTDRGEVYVVLGPPDEVYDASTTLGQEGRYYQWAYYDLRVALIFQDVNGFGRFRLTPTSRSEFERVRARVQQPTPR